MTQINERLYLGGQEHANDIRFLRQRNITHIINCASEGRNAHPREFVYMNLCLDDVENETIDVHFDKTHQVMKDPNHVVYVHCMAGVSRSATVVIAHLMRHMRWSLLEAYTMVVSKRSIVQPNIGFWKQLIQLEQQLCDEGLLLISSESYSLLDYVMQSFFINHTHRKLIEQKLQENNLSGMYLMRLIYQLENHNKDEIIEID